ncbi:RXT2-like protein [Truncatella angustata]|uniref:RXT2-like protein n=1 Tax=Truncatella angustata TaxID=152316 RepID=A0A9P8ZUJ9_9PEZI|nr:RXT2-like protein [Truncatella angustata]KAH6648109.1 RXT2-like protein [Truncatella angustata]
MSQQALFADTIIAMKKAMKRRAYESEDSDDDINYRGNRGQKLNKRARFAREGQLAPGSGPEVYKEVVEHAGYTRAIISRNPPLVDDEGYEPESDDEDYEQRMQDIVETAAQFNPYANVRLENILAPLTAVTELPSHPTLSRPYTSRTLVDLTIQARDIMYKENTALWNIKHLHTKLVGDHIWVPTEMMETPNDIHFFQEPALPNGLSLGQPSVKSDASMLLLDAAPAASTHGQPSTNGEETSVSNKDVTIDEETAADDESKPSAGEDMNREGDHVDSDSKMEEASGTSEVEIKKPKTSSKKPLTNGALRKAEQNGVSSHDHALQRTMNGSEINLPGSAPMSIASVDGLDDMFIHPIFLAPKSSKPERDLSIPEQEAEDLRRLLQAYCQKQEEVCRGTKRLHEGLLRAERLRKTVIQWSKYEAHVGPNRDMSDGEDWYDKEEWGLEEDLKKGADEEEEDTTTQPKKTRARK